MTCISKIFASAIAPNCNPLQVADVIIKFAAVFLINFWLAVGIWNKRCANENVHVMAFGLRIFLQAHAQISFWITVNIRPNFVDKIFIAL